MSDTIFLRTASEYVESSSALPLRSSAVAPELPFITLVDPLPKKTKTPKKTTTKPRKAPATQCTTQNLHILLDEREGGLHQKLIDKDWTAYPHLTLTKQVLLLGDVVIQPHQDPEGPPVVPYMILERKSLPDLLSSIKDGRYEEQSHRLTHASGIHPHNIGYVIEGVLTTLSLKDRNLVYSTMTSLNHFKGYSVFRTTGVQDTADFLVCLAHKLQRNLEQGKVPKFPNATANATVPVPVTATATVPASASVPDIPYCQVVKSVKKDNLTPDNIGEVILCQIPHINTVTAVAIMKQFRTIKALIDALCADPDCLNGFYLTTTGTGTKTGEEKRRKLSSLAVSNLLKFLVPVPEEA